MIPTPRTTIGKRPPKTIESTHPHETPPRPLTLSPLEWEAKRASAPRTLSFAHIDLLNRTHVLNYYDTAVGKEDPFTPFLRVTNSFNGGRALRFDMGFMRNHCSNSVILTRKRPPPKPLTKGALNQLKNETNFYSSPQI
jgi:hypothetical protein